MQQGGVNVRIYTYKNIDIYIYKHKKIIYIFPKISRVWVASERELKGNLVRK